MNVNCPYDYSTGRYSKCDGHHRCECIPVEPKVEERHSSTDSHAVLIAEIARLRESRRKLANLVSAVAMACDLDIVKGLKDSWAREAREAVEEASK